MTSLVDLDVRSHVAWSGPGCASFGGLQLADASPLEMARGWTKKEQRFQGIQEIHEEQNGASTLLGVETGGLEKRNPDLHFCLPHRVGNVGANYGS